MNSTKDFLHQILDPKLSPSQRAQLRCQLAKQLEDAGNYEAAQDAMGELWRGIGDRPHLEDLDQRTAADVLLRIGSLTGYIGSAKQIENSQELAKNWITESIVIFESLRAVKKVAEAQTEIAVCYGREGQLDNARAMLFEALCELDEKDGDLNGRALLRSAIIEKLAHRLSDSLIMLTKAAPLLEGSTNHTLRGSFHNEFANVLMRLGATKDPSDYIDRAVIEYTAASFHFEQAGHARYQARAWWLLGRREVSIDQNRLHYRADHARNRARNPHVNQTSRTNTIVNALKQRAQSVLNDQSIRRVARLFVTLWRRTIRGWQIWCVVQMRAKPSSIRRAT